MDLGTTDICPPQVRAASTRPTAFNEDGFVEDSPSRSRKTFSVNRVLRGGEGAFLCNPSHRCPVKSFVKSHFGVYIKPISFQIFFKLERKKKSLQRLGVMPEEPRLPEGPMGG